MQELREMSLPYDFYCSREVPLYDRKRGHKLRGDGHTDPLEHSETVQVKPFTEILVQFVYF